MTDRLLPHERGLAALAAAAAAALLLRGAWALSLEVAAAAALGAAGARALSRRAGAWPVRMRLVGTYAWVLWFYLGVQRFTPALGLPVRDGALLHLDRALLGETPARLMDAWRSPALTDLMSAGYLSYLVYLHGALLLALLGPPDAALRLGRAVFLAYVPGFAGYLLVPARGPAHAFPELFPAPLQGGFFTSLNASVVASGSSVFDVFPSLHVLITLSLLAHDARHARRRFLAMLAPAALLSISTLYLRYHYAIDVLAAVVIWGALQLATRPAAPPPAPPTPAKAAPPGSRGQARIAALDAAASRHDPRVRSESVTSLV